MSFAKNRPQQPADTTLRTIRLSALVPVYNEKETLVAIVDRLEQVDVVHQIVIVDDCSVDGTRAIIEELVAAGRVDACFHDRNRGKGAALRTAIALASEEYLVIQDADLEYNPNDFLAMVDVIRQQNAQVVYGSRFMGGPRSGMLWTHYLGNRLLTLAFNLIFGQRLTDMETCYKLFRTDLLRQLQIDNDSFDIDPELTAKIVRAGQQIYEVPISYAGRTYLAGKKIKMRDAWSAIRTLLHYRRWRVPVPAEDAHSAVASR